VAFQYYYDAASNETQRYCATNGVAQTYGRDALNRMTRRDAKKGATSLSYELYTYNPMDQVTIVDREASNDDRFGYYLDGELKWATYGGGGSATYTLDQAGNRLSVDYGSGPNTYTPDVINQYSVGEGSPVVNGSEHEIASVWGANYTYINDGPLSSIYDGVKTTGLAYDALRRLVKRSIDGSPSRYYIYDGERIIFEYNINGTVVGRNVYGKGIDEILSRTTGGTTYYYQQDHEGSVTHLTSATGTVLEKYLYDAFGATTFYNGSGTEIGGTAYFNSFLFTGRRMLTWDTYEYRARIYNMYLGRFMSEDPKLFDAGDYNLFRYCHNDPLDLTDPMGLDYITVTFTHTSSPEPISIASGQVHHGMLAWHNDDGKVLRKLDVTSGGYKSKNPPSHVAGAETKIFDGKYKATQDLGGKESGASKTMERDGVRFRIELKAQFKADPNNYQTDLRIHPDGGPIGTQGCIGLVGDRKALTSFQSAFNDYVDKNGPLNVEVRTKERERPPGYDQRGATEPKPQ
jgi:RHS repeat-associated protein